MEHLKREVFVFVCLLYENPKAYIFLLKSVGGINLGRKTLSKNKQNLYVRSKIPPLRF